MGVSHELELLNIVAARGAGLFACEQWDVFSDVSVPLVNGYVTIKVEDTFGEFHQLKRKDSATWRSSARRQSRCSPSTWRIATACSHLAQTTVATGSSAHGVRMSSPKGAWITTTSTRSRPSMWPRMVHAKQTGRRE